MQVEIIRGQETTLKLLQIDIKIDVDASVVAHARKQAVKSLGKGAGRRSIEKIREEVRHSVVSTTMVAALNEARLTPFSNQRLCFIEASDPDGMAFVATIIASPWPDEVEAKQDDEGKEKVDTSDTQAADTPREDVPSVEDVSRVES